MTAPARVARIARIEPHDLELLQSWLYGRPPTTRRQYARVASEFLDGAGKPLAEVSLRDLQLYVDRIAADRKAATVRAYVYALKSLSTFAFRTAHVSHNLAALLRVPPVSTHPAERILSEEHTWKLINAPRSQRHRVLLRTLYLTGARVSEISRLRIADVAQHENGGALLWLTRKGGRRDGVWVPASLLAELRAIAPPNAPPESFVFRSQGSAGRLMPRGIGRMVARYAKRAGLGRVSPHFLRHCHGTHALAHGAPLALVQRTMGHASLATTGLYLHPATGDSSARFLA